MTDTGDWSAVLDVWEADLAVRRQLAEAATPGPWLRSGAYLATPDAEFRLLVDAQHTIANDPASVLADIATQQATITMLRGVLERHRLMTITAGDIRIERCRDCGLQHPCPDYAAAVAVIDTIRTTQENR